MNGMLSLRLSAFSSNTLFIPLSASVTGSADCRKSAGILGFRARYSIEQGLKGLLDVHTHGN